MRRIVLAVWVALSGCALGVPAILDDLNEGELGAIVRAKAGPSAAAPRFQRLAVARFTYAAFPVTTAMNQQLATCAKGLKTRGLAAEVGLLLDRAPVCSRLRSARHCAERAVEAYRAAALEDGYDAILVAALVNRPWGAAPKVIRDGRAAAFPDATDAVQPRSEPSYVTEGALLETDSGAVRASGLGVSDPVPRGRPTRGGLPDPTLPRLPPPPVVDLGAQSVRRFCADLEAQLFGE